MLISTTQSIFQTYPLADEPVLTSVGPQPTPYHVYDGHLVLIGGTADRAAVRDLLRHERVTPVETQSGRTLMALWVAEEPEASHGPHSELQISFYVSSRPLPPVPDRPFALLRFLLTNPEARQMCHGLWNDTEAVVAYNREILGLSPRLAHYSFERKNGRVRFTFDDAERNAPIVRGDVREPQRPTPRATLALFRSFGLMGALRAATARTIELKVVNPISPILTVNADARTISASDAVVADLYDPIRDCLEILDPIYGALDFVPTFVEHMAGFNLVYLTPQPISQRQR